MQLRFCKYQQLFSNLFESTLNFGCAKKSNNKNNNETCNYGNGCAKVDLHYSSLISTSYFNISLLAFFIVSYFFPWDFFFIHFIKYFLCFLWWAKVRGLTISTRVRRNFQSGLDQWLTGPVWKCSIKGIYSRLTLM